MSENWRKICLFAFKCITDATYVHLWRSIRFVFHQIWQFCILHLCFYHINMTLLGPRVLDMFLNPLWAKPWWQKWSSLLSSDQRTYLGCDARLRVLTHDWRNWSPANTLLYSTFYTDMSGFSYRTFHMQNAGLYLLTNFDFHAHTVRENSWDILETLGVLPCSFSIIQLCSVGQNCAMARSACSARLENTAEDVKGNVGEARELETLGVCQCGAAV